MPEIELTKAWNHLLAMSGIPLEVGQPEFTNICRAYSEPHRHYHTLKHIEYLLIILKQANFDSPAGLWAVWYHDYIYEPGGDSNEISSAEYAERVMTQLGVERSIINKTIDIILATKDHRVDAASAEMLTILDADMAILGEAPATYEEYRAQVQDEFRSVPTMLYRIGRKKFLESVLSQRRIYQTEWFAERYESRARQNILKEIDDCCK